MCPLPTGHLSQTYLLLGEGLLNLTPPRRTAPANPPGGPDEECQSESRAKSTKQIFHDRSLPFSVPTDDGMQHININIKKNQGFLRSDQMIEKKLYIC